MDSPKTAFAFVSFEMLLLEELATEQRHLEEFLALSQSVWSSTNTVESVLDRADVVSEAFDRTQTMNSSRIARA